MAVTRSNVGTTGHQSVTGTSPQSLATPTVTIGASDTALFVAVSYGVQVATHVVTAAVKADPAGANVSLTQVASARVNGAGGTDQDGYTDIFVLQNPVASLGTGSKGITVTMSGWAGSAVADLIVIPWTVQGAIGTIAGGHATSVNLASTISSGSLTVGTGGYGAAIAVNGTAAPTVNTGTSLASVTGSTTSGGDNALVLDETANGALIANTNSGDEEALSWITVTAAAGGPTPIGKSLVFQALDTAYNW